MNGAHTPTKAESQWMGRVKGMRCICCELLDRQQEAPTDVHHIREGREQRNHWLTLPLCWHCHQGPRGIHGDKSILRMLKSSEVGLLAVVISKLFKAAA